MKSLQIKNDLWVNLLPVEVPVQQEATQQQPTNQFLIFDRSGSMWGYLKSIMEAAKEYCKQLSEGSTVSVGYFSGQGEYALTVPYILKKELDGCIKTIDSYKEAIGLTCFNEILEKVNSIAKTVGGKSSLYFFTDGCHNTGGTEKDIEEQLKQWTNYAGITMFVGCGYIDRDMMTWMAKISDGSFIHLDKFENFKETLESFGLAVDDLAPSVEIDLTNYSNITTPISISGRNVISYTVQDNKIKYKTSKRGWKGLYSISTSKPSNSEEISKVDATVERGIRALAFSLSQNNDAPTALELLNFLGDKYLVRTLYNSIAPEEYSVVEKCILKSIYSTKDRFLEGEVKGFLPDPNAFCILDVVNALIEDGDVNIHLKDKDFKYNYISRPTHIVDGPKVIYSDDMSAKLNDIVMNKERLNISFSTYAEGHVDLLSDEFKINPPSKDTLELLDIPLMYPVKSFKTYNIIADGKINTPRLVLSNLKKETLNKLGKYAERRNDGKYIITLEGLPIINKSYATLTSAKILAENVWTEKVLMDHISVINSIKKSNNNSKPVFVSLSEEQKQYLLEHCYISNNSYSPSKSTSEVSDEYDAYSFSIDMKGFSKASASDVIKKIKEGKKPTNREIILEEAYNSLKQIESESFTTIDEECDKLLSTLKGALREIRKSIQSSKFAIILANKGKMDEFKSRENMELDLKCNTLNSTVDVKFMFNIKRIKVKI